MTDTFLADFDADRARRRNQSVGRAQEAITLNSSTAPAQVSRAQRDAQLLGIPTAAVLGDPMFSAEAKAKRDSEYLAQAPAAARWLADDDNAAVAHDQVEQLSTLENLLAGVGSRALNLGAGLGRSALTSLEGPVRGIQDAARTVGFTPREIRVGPGGVTTETIDPNGSISPASSSLIRRGEQATLGYVAGTSWEDVKRQPVQSIIPFALEQGIVSVPDMVAAVVNLPLYISARTGEIGQTRAENDGREDATVEDLVTALPVASASALLERFATRGLLGMGSPVRTIGQVPGAVARSTLREGTTEAAQEGIESAGETVGTQRGFSVAETADRALAGFVGGAPFGGAVRTVTAPVEVAVQRRQAAQAAEGQAAAFDEKRQAVLASPLRELVPERFRDYLRMASPPDAQVIVPGEAVVSFFQSNPDLDRWMDEWDIRDQVEQAAVAGTDVVFDQGTYLGSVVGTQADTAWARDLKFGDKAMSVNEAVEAEAEGEQELADVFARAVGAGESVQAVQSAYDRVQSDIKAKLRETGMGEQEARYAALLSADRYASRSEREGYADAWEAYQADGGVTFRQNLPPSVQAQKDRLDLVVAAMKSRDTGPTQRQLYGDSLLEFVSANGGIEDTGGDLASMDAAAWSNPRVAGRVGRRSIIRRPGSEPGAFGPDEVLTRAIEAGYFRDDASVNDLFEAVRGELAGQNRFSDSFARNNRTEETIKAADELADLLTQAGLDPQQASNEEIRAFVDGMGVEGGSDVRASYDQSGKLITDSEAFRAWFGDSKVVDENGQPLVVYHGTPADFEAFDRDRVGGRWDVSFGFHFSDRADEASIYAGSELGSTDGQVLPVYLKLENPLEIETGLEAWRKADDDRGEIIRAVVESRRAAARDNPEARRAADAALFEGLGLEAPPRNYDPLKAYDGVIIRGRDGVNVIAFDPTQIKSVFNRGTFDPADPRILYQSEVSGLTEDQYIERINPEGRRIAEGDRPNLGMGDMYGMAPKGARQIATMQDTELGRIRIVESGGDVYALANNPDLGEEDVVGYMIDRDGSTELAVVSEAQGKGIGAELSYQFRSRNPFAQSGGLTEAGEATARAAYRRMTREGRTLYQFAGEGAQTAPLAELARAKEMEADGGLSSDIWEATGWGRGDDGKWRFEISDQDAKLTPDAASYAAAEAMSGRNYITLGEILDHKPLFEAYPALSDTLVAVMPLGHASGAVGFDKGLGKTVLIFDSDVLNEQPEKALRVAVHEVQHLIQRVEGFAAGSSSTVNGLVAAGYGPELRDAAQSRLDAGFDGDMDMAQASEAFQIYRRSSGEIEARNTEKRANMTDAERRAMPPAYTRDISADKAIVKLDDGGQSLMVTESALRQDTPMSGPRGEIVFREAGATITFFKARDRSTFIHEMGHKWLDELIIDAARPAATEQTKADLQTVMDWFSKEAGETITAENFGVDQHELWARGWERYLMEGVSPSLELRAVFSRFADWIKRIYKNVANLNAPISNPVRDVMSRMIATDDQLASVREVQNLNRIFGDAKAGNMTKAEFEALTKADNDAWEASRERAYKSVMEPLRREATAAWKEERETLRDGQTEKVDAMPDVAALRLLEETGERLNRKALIDQAGTKEVLKLLPNRRPAIYSNDGVWHPDALAVEVGVANGDQLINALMEHEQERQNRRAQGDMRSVRDARIEDAMDAEMRFLNDDPLTDGRLETLANIAVHEKLKAKSLAMEATQLSKLAGRNALWTEEGIEAYARDTISNLRAVKINPSQYLRAERSAGLRAQRALLKKDYAKALDAKLVQVVNFQLYRSAIDAQEEVAKAEKLFSKVVRAKDQAASKSRNFDMVNAAREILAAYGLTRKSGQDASVYMAAVAQYDPDAYAALKETIDTAVEVAAPLDQLSLQDFRELTEVIDQLWNLSRRTQVMEIEGRRVELQTARGEIVGDLTANRGARPGKRGLDKAVTQKERLMSDLLSIRSYLGKVEEWAMRQGPAFTKYIYRPVSQGADGYRTLLREHMPKLEAALKTLRPDIEKPFKIDAREISYTFGHDGGNGVIEIIGAMRHMGNASNYRKLILGRGWGTKNPDGSLDDTAFQAMMSRLQAEGVIQKRHWDYVQAEWDLHDEIKPHVQRAHRRMTGRYFEEITSNAVETPFGIYKGGYVPAKVDPALDPRAAEFDLQGILANGTNGSFVWPGPANGFTKGRVEYNKPLDLDLRKALSQFDEAMKYAMIGPAVQDVTRLLRDTEFAEVMNDYDQGVWNDFLQPWLVRAVSQRVTEPSDHPLMRRVEGAMSFVTRRTGAMIMFANVVNAAQQFTGFFPAMIRTGKVNMATALRDYVKNPAGMADKVAASSAFMANRLGSEMRDLSIEANRIKLAPGPYGRAAEWTERHAYFLQKGVQNMMDPIVWTAAYNRATERGEENPVAYADMVIRTTQDSYNAEDATKFATGSKFAAPFKMFSGYFIGQANLISTEVTIAAREKNYGRIAEIYTLGIFITAVGSEVIAQGLRGELGDEDDDGWWDDLADVFLISQLRYAAAFIPFVGQGVNALLGALDDKPYNDRLSLSPIVSTGEAVIRTVPNTINVIQGDADASRTVKDYSTVISLATGLPTFQRQTGYVADVLEGDVEPVGPVDAARGFISGRASEESRTD